MTNLKTRLYLIAAGILLVGLGSAVSIYLTAEDASDDVSMSEFTHSKQYRHELEAYGGKMNVLASDFVLWFDGLWHGKSLAVTIACITIATCLVIVFLAYQLPSGSNPDHRDENNRG
ncbi:MAG: hypothetical protein ACM3ON_10790 [Chloroflexota bacterium]